MINQWLPVLTGLQEAFVSRQPNKDAEFTLSPATTPLAVIHNVLKRRPNFITFNHHSRRNQSCENPILLFLLKTKLAFVSLLNYTIGEVYPFFLLLFSVFLRVFTFYFFSFGHDLAAPTIQFAYASYLFDVYLPTDPRNYDYGRWPRKTSPDLARILYMSSTPGKPSYSLRFDPPKLSSTQTSPCTESALFR